MKYLSVNNLFMFVENRAQTDSLWILWVNREVYPQRVDLIFIRAAALSTVSPA